VKHIVKQAEPDAFKQWKALANPDWQPTYADLRGEPKQAVKHALMAEQGHICCYCERRLTENDSHIEHFMPQESGKLTLDFSNLLCSCQNNVQTGEPRHCGNLKDHWFDSALLISPLKPDCEKRFAFTGDGGMQPADGTDQAAITTIEKLGLDIPKLRALRAKAIEPFLDEQLSTDELNRFVAGYLCKDSAGCFAEFWTTIQYLFSDQSATINGVTEIIT
jgi:uncharacterized protein (TIGR02646 family)